MKGLITVFVFNILDIITTGIFYNISFDNGDFREINIFYHIFGIQIFLIMKLFFMSFLLVFVYYYFNEKLKNRFSLIVGTVYFFVILSNITSIIFYIGN